MSVKDNNKKVFIENLIYLCAEQNFRTGFPYYNQNFNKRLKLFHPAINSGLKCYFILKFIISLIITEDFYSLIIGDFVYKYKFKIHICLILLISSFNVISIDLFNNFKSKLINKKLNINELKFNSNHSKAKSCQNIFEFIQSFFNVLFLPYGFIMSMVFMSVNSSITYLMTIGLFWSVLFGLSAYVVVASYSWNLIYFLLISYYSRFLLKSENQSLKRMANKKIINSFEILTHLRYIDVLYRKIMGYNEIWSNFVMINWFDLQILISISIVLILESDNFKIRLLVIGSFLVVLSFVVIIIIFCSSLNSESKKSHKFLAQLISSNKLKIFPRIRIKVSKVLKMDILD